MVHEEARLGYPPKAGIVTVSESRYLRYMRGDAVDDESGDLAEELLRGSGINNVERVLVGDRVWMICSAINKLVNSGCELIVVIGGTGLSKGDVTAEALESIIERRLNLYPVLYGIKSVDEVDTRVLATRLVAGFYRDALIVSTPGSKKAVESILKNVLKSEYIHLLWLNKFAKI